MGEIPSMNEIMLVSRVEERGLRRLLSISFDSKDPIYFSLRKGELLGEPKGCISPLCLEDVRLMMLPSGVVDTVIGIKYGLSSDCSRVTDGVPLNTLRYIRV